MRIIPVIHGGFALFDLCPPACRLKGSGHARTPTTAPLSFVPRWLIVAGANMTVGVTQAGYSIREELPIFLLIFTLPGAIAALIWWKFS